MHRTEGANNVAGLYSAGPPPTTITADALNSIQEELAAVIEYSGQAMQTAATDTRNQLLAALLALIPTYDAIVVSQASWDTIIERTAANTYQFKGDYKSIFVKVGDYALTLSGGDTWGQLQTNNVTHLEFERKAAITFGNTPGYLNINTASCYLKNVTVKGLGTVASAVQYSFLLSATAVTFDNCVATTRLSNTNMTGFQGSGTVIHNLSTRYVNCRVSGLTSSGNISGFYLCQNMVGCIVNSCACTGAGVFYGFSTCDNISSSQVYILDSVNGNCAGFYSCNQISACKVSDIDTSGTANAFGFSTCNQVSSCIATDIASATGDAFGFFIINHISACTSTEISGGDGVGDTGEGFYGCNYIVACYTEHLSGNVRYGYRECKHGAALGVNASLVGSNLNCSYMDTSSGGITADWSITDIFV